MTDQILATLDRFDPSNPYHSGAVVACIVVLPFLRLAFTAWRAAR